MDATTRVNDLLRHLGDFALDEGGRCLVAHESGVQFAVETIPGADFLSFYAPLAELPADCPAEFLKHVLHLNLLQVRTRGGAVAFDPTNGWLVHSLSIDLAGLDDVAFGNAISNLIPTILSLRQEMTDALSALGTVSDGTTPPDDPDAGSGPGEGV